MNKHFLMAICLLILLTSCSNKSSFDIDGSKISNKVENNVEKDNLNQEGIMTNTINTIIVMQTNMGIMKLKLYDDKAPITVANFKKLVNEGFYDGLIFHRIISNFMIQGGDPKGTGMGGPGYEIKDEFHPSLKHSKKGILSMANAGPNTGGSQFFITLIPTPWLDNKHSVFGEVVEGLYVLEKIGKVETDANNKPIKDVVIKKVYVE